ncbi:MAG: 3-oxoacyl-[acyl-carrier-protein] synthase [Deltaproteobacteria bacterium]|nr:3-oxoacyl-[acyl-carrier-protein] synthase [Deltaproteobacteria bacterium]
MYIDAVSHYLPATIIHNESYQHLAGVSAEWIEKRSGIRSRTRACCHENTSTMAVEACKHAFEQIPYPAKEIDLIVGATYTPYDTIVTLAHAVQHFFDVPKARAISISSACSSFINAIEVVEGYFATGKARKALVIASEHNSAYSDDTDAQSGPLWGDGAGAVFISKEKVSDKDLEILDINTTGLGHLGKAMDAIHLRPGKGGLKMPAGRDIFMNAIRYMVAEVKTILKKNHYTTKDIAYLIPHQANLRIIAQVGEALGLHNGEVVTNVEDTGNTGCASTIIALSQNWEKFKKDELIAVTVFGGGYSSGAMLLKK